MARENQLIRIAGIESRIHLIRGQRVMFDADLADLYAVETKALNKAVKRNRDRFPEDFMFRLTSAELSNMRSQIGTASPQPNSTLRFQTGTASKRNLRFLPYVFTREGIAMLSGILRSKRAVAVNIEIMRAFVRLQKFLATQGELASKLVTLKRNLGSTTRTFRLFSMCSNS